MYMYIYIYFLFTSSIYNTVEFCYTTDASYRLVSLGINGEWSDILRYRFLFHREYLDFLTIFVH